MGALQAVGVGLTAALAILLLREVRPSTALPVRLCALLLLLGGGVAFLACVMQGVQGLLSLSGSANGPLLLRGVGIALVCELGALLCREMGEGGLAEGVLFFGRMELLVLSLPLLDEVLELAKELLNF